MDNLDPVAYPKITIGDREFELKFRCSDVIELKKTHNIDIFSLPSIQGVDAIEFRLTMLSMAIKHTANLSPADLATMIDFGRISEVDALVGEAIKKAAAQINATRPIPDAPTPAVQ